MSPRTLPTTCPLDCPDTCLLEAEVEDERVLSLGGRPESPVTAGFICAKVSKAHEQLDHPNRLTRPQRRVGPKGSGRFEPISWDQAVDEITERFRDVAQRHGGEAILPFHYGGSNGLLSDGFLDALYFHRLGASRLLKTICAAPSTAVARGMSGRMPGVAYTDYRAARLIVLWGANPRTSHIHLMPFVQEARQRGATVVSLDPVRRFSDRQVDLHLAPLPGADLPLALGLVHHVQAMGALDRPFLADHANNLQPLLDAAAAWPPARAAREAGVAEDDLIRLAELYAESSPAVIRTGWGLERNHNGGRAMAAILSLPVLLGKMGVRGGGFTMSNSGAVSFDREAVLGEMPATTRAVNMTRLGRWIDPQADAPEPPIHALFVYNANPVATVPDQRAILRGLAREDLFTVVFDPMHTDTAQWADVLLPATTFLEHRDLQVAYGHYVVGGVQPVVPRRGQARPNVEAFAALGRAMGFDDAPFTWDEETCLRRAAGHLRLNGRPADVETLLEGGAQAVEFPGEGGPVQMIDVHPATADGRFDLAPPELGAEPYAYRPVRDRSPGFPLTLLSPADPKRINSTLGERPEPRLAARLHPDEAAARHLTPGDPVRVFNRLGEVRCPVRVDPRVRPGVVILPKGAWRRTSDNGFTSTSLVPDEVNDVGSGACFHDARVEVERVSSG